MRTSRQAIVGLVSVSALSLLAVGCGSSGSGGGSSTTSVSKSSKINPKTGLPVYKKNVTLTFWSWVPNDKKRVQIFEKYYPNIKVKLEDVGAGTPEYQKFSTAVQSGSGAPDVVMLEYDMMPQFIQSGGLRPITSYVKPFSSKFPKWVMNQVSYKNQIYSVPEDTGPLGLYYQKSIFSKDNIKVPTTWAQYKTEAASFHKQNPSKYWSYFATNDAQWQLGLLWAAGINPFQQTSNGWKINLDSPKAVKVFQYWGNLIKSGAVEATSDGSPGFQKQLGAGQFATIVGSAWYPSEFLVPYDKKLSQHNWRAAMTPEWSAGQTVDGDWGGSADAVTKQSKHPEAAAIFATFINTSKYEQPHNVKPAKQGGGGLFPAYEGGFKTSQFQAGNPALGGQKANEQVFKKEATNVDASWQWNPWISYTFNELSSQLTKAAKGQESWKQALTNTQNKIVTYAKSQGYKVQG